MTRVWVALMAAGALGCTGGDGTAHDDEDHRITGFAVLAANTFVNGPTSGQFIEAANGVTVPFTGRQPIQGFSDILLHPTGGFLVISDNGYGGRDNSSDFVLRVTHIVPEFRTADGGSGTIEVVSSVVVTDPDSIVGIPLVSEGESYPNGAGDVPVDGWIGSARAVTGADLDIESFRRVADGSLWLGDEFGPFLVHVDTSGAVLGPVVGLPGVFAPENPLRGSSPINGHSSGGFEGMARSPDGRTLYPILEKPIEGGEPGVLNIYQFDTATAEYVGEGPIRRYPLESAEHRIGAFSELTERTFLIVERDRNEGREATFKKIYLVDFDAADAGGRLEKRELVDLLRIPDPDRIASSESHFTFPFVTTEGVLLIDDHTIGVANDNNFPFSVGRHVEEGLPDDNEIILIRFAVPLTGMRIAGMSE